MYNTFNNSNDLYQTYDVTKNNRINNQEIIPANIVILHDNNSKSIFCSQTAFTIYSLVIFIGVVVALIKIFN